MEKYERKNEILLDGTEQCLTIRGYYAYFENCGSNTVYISKNTGIIPNSDGVMQLCPGESGEYALPIDGRIYVKGTGCVSVTGSDCPRTVKCNGENLLINPDFRINQRGAKGVIGSAGYFVDRWKLLEGTVTINQDHSITLNGKIAQQLENPPEGQLCPSVSAGSLAYYDRNSGTFYIESNGGTIKWAKLEHGSEPTSFIPPEQGSELAKCQRFFYRAVSNAAFTNYLALGSAISADTARFVFYFPVTMRCAPLLKYTATPHSMFLWQVGTAACWDDEYATALSSPYGGSGNMTIDAVIFPDAQHTDSFAVNVPVFLATLADNDESTYCYIDFDAEL